MGVGWAIVAVPREDDPVWKYSSEKIPHMTLLFLGDQTGKTDPVKVTEYIEHVCKTSLQPFGMSVERRGELGPDKADVLFFDDYRSSISVPKAARDFFLKNDDIAKAYNSIEQYPQWTPHLTMGYPTAPAKQIASDRPIMWVSFDKIALWTGDFTGPEFILHYPESEAAEQMTMTDIVSAGAAFLQHKTFSADKRKQLAGNKAMADGSFPIENASDLANAIRLAGNAKNPEAARKHIIARAKALGLSDKIPDTWNSDGTMKHSDVSKFLEHFGVKGMHWGVRKREPVTSTTVSSKGGKIKKVQLSDRVHTQRSKPSTDATRFAVAKAVVKKHSTDSLSNEELKSLVTRMQLEQQYSNLSTQQQNAGHKFVNQLLGNAAKQQANQVVNQAAAQAVKKAMHS